MSNFKKHKRLYYVPGILSLIVIPLVFWFYGNNYLKENDFRVIKFNMPPKNHFEEFPDFVPEIHFNSSPIIVPPNFSDETELKYLNLVKDLQEKTSIKQD